MSDYGSNQPPQDPYGQNPYGQGGQPPQGSYPQGSYDQGSYGQPPQPPQGPYGSTGGTGANPYGGSPAQQGKGFVGALFDLSFTTFVTPMIIKVVYVIGLIAIGILTVIFAFSGFFGDSPAVGVITLILSPLVGLLYLCFFRMMCEFYLAITRMSEDINRRLPRG